jgi:hypothetical protein
MPSKVTAVIKNKFFLSLSGNVIMSGLGMLTMAIIYRSLPINEAGIWVYFSATVVFIDTFRSGLCRFQPRTCRGNCRVGMVYRALYNGHTGFSKYPILIFY